ncbi:MAG: transposase [Candidatus Electrothrix gigas]
MFARCFHGIPIHCMGRHGGLPLQDAGKTEAVFLVWYCRGEPLCSPGVATVFRFIAWADTGLPLQYVPAPVFALSCRAGTGTCPYTIMKYNPDIHHRRSIRLRNYDYAQAGAYFVTICLQYRECLFGKITVPPVGADPCVCPGFSPEIQLTDAGRMVQTIWDQIPNHYPGVDTDAFVVMPNHIHGIVVLTNPVAGTDSCVRPNPRSRYVPTGQARGPAPTKPLSLPDVVQRYKSLTTTQYINGVKQNGWPPFLGKLWQRNYWEHIIRNETELHRIRKYIQNNPARWQEDALHPDQGPFPGETREASPSYGSSGHEVWMV